MNRPSVTLELNRIFPAQFVYPSPSLAGVLARAGIILYGADTPSMDDADSKELPSHHALLHHDMRVLENLVLDDVAEGDFELIALPLRLTRSDASPVRAILRTLA